MSASSTTILAIETSCDDTAAAVLRDGRIRSNIISSQTIHNEWGGIVPELASREHVKAIGYIVDAAMAEAGCGYHDLSAIAVTYGPGLPGSLLVGTQFAKGLALRLSLPLYPIHHIEAHVYSGFMEEPSLTFPVVSLVVSGGHTAMFLVESWQSYKMIGSTRDDAAGEGFDKVAKMLGLGYPGGPHIDRLAAVGNANAFAFPRGLHGEAGYDFSFSGLKTAVRREVQKHQQQHFELDQTFVNNVAASVQRAIVDVLVQKTVSAAEHYGVSKVVVAGGVSSNSELRSTMQAACDTRGWTFIAPRGAYCVDNAAMIGYVAYQKILAGHVGTMLFGIEPKALRAR